MLSENLSTQTSALSTPFRVLQDDWVMLAPMGDFAHELGIQRFTPATIQNMANRFNGLLGKLGRLFSGAPTFEGHHDIEPDKYPNSKSYGWIMSLDARADGLWGRMVWTPEGREMLQNGAFKFVSPVFLGKPIGQENGRTVFDPVAFKSLALTNQPNLPLPPLANTKDSMTTITSLLELPNEASADQILEAVTRLKGQVTTLSNETTNLRQSEKSVVEKSSTLETNLANAIARADATQTRLVGMILENAVRESRITLAQRDHWKAELEKDLAAAEAQLAKQQPTLNTTSVTRELGNEKGAYDTEATRRAALVGYISEQQAKGLTYDEAWSRAKVERAALFEHMVRK
jgi:phage I-like protein